MNQVRRSSQTRNSWAVVTVVLMTTVAFGCSPGKTYRDVVQKVADRPVGDLTRETSVAQVFVPNHDRLSAISVQMATWGRTNNCDVVIHVRQEGSDRDLASRSLKCSEVVNNAWVTVDVPPIKDSLEKRFVMVVDSPNGAPGNAVTLWMASAPVYPDGQLFLKGQPIGGALAFVTYHQ